MTNNAKATVIVLAKFRNGYEEHFEDYSLKVKNLLSKHKAQIIRRQLIKETLYGDESSDLIMLIDFEDVMTPKKIFFEEEYLQIIPLRNKVFTTFKMFISEFSDKLL